MTSDAYAKIVELISHSAEVGVLKKAVLSKPLDKENIKSILTNTSINTQKVKTSNKMSVEETLNTYFKPEEDFNPHGTSTNNKL